MSTSVVQPQVLVFTDMRINYQVLITAEPQSPKTPSLFRTLTEKGLDRLTSSKIEQVICTSALSAHI